MNPLAKLTNWYFSKNTLPIWGILLIDCIIVYVSSYIVSVIGLGNSLTRANLLPLGVTLFVYLCFFIIGFRIFRTYAGVIRYSSFVDLQRVGSASLFGMIMSIAVDLALNHMGYLVHVPIIYIVLWTFISVLLMWTMRVVVKYMFDIMYKRSEAQRVFIYGVKDGGVSIAKSIRNQGKSKYVLEGFVSDEEEMESRILMGVKVYPLDDELLQVMDRHSIKALFVSPLRSESLRQQPELVDKLITAGVKIFMVPSEEEWDGKSDINHNRLREIDIEDLLPRDKIEVDMKSIGELLKGKRIMITGAAGSIGSEMVRQIASFAPQELILIDQAETPLHDVRLMMARNWPSIAAHTIVSDIANKDRMREIFEQYKPQYVFHAAAYKHVPMMENNPGESIRNNVEGTRIIADLSVANGVDKFVMISTDKAVNPTNVMGCSKRICEIYVQSLDKAMKDGKVEGKTQFVTTRFGNVLGSNGSVIPLFKEQIRNGGPITVTHPDIIRYFMLIPEACRLVLEAGTMGHGGEIFVFDMGKPVKIVDLAKRMIQLSGVKIDIVFTGLRDGEKLYEEVLNDKEVTLPTFHPKIKIAKVREYDYVYVNQDIDDLFVRSGKGDDMDIVKKMKEIVPEFKSQHSIYEVLDK